MHGRTRSTVTTTAGAVVVLMLAACGGGAASPPAGTKAPAATTPPIVQAAGPAAKVTGAEVAFRATGGSSVAGTATFAQVEEKVAYHVVVSGAAAGPHTLYIFSGAVCDTTGNRTGPLNSVEATADGAGSADGTILTQLGTLVGRSLAVYASDKGDSEVIACGPIAAR